MIVIETQILHGEELAFSFSQWETKCARHRQMYAMFRPFVFKRIENSTVIAFDTRLQQSTLAQVGINKVIFSTQVSSIFCIF